MFSVRAMTRTNKGEATMNAYEREIAQCAADEEARADRRFRAWRRRQVIAQSLCTHPRFSVDRRIAVAARQLRDAV